jgi:hypothetical protein
MDIKLNEIIVDLREIGEDCHENMLAYADIHLKGNHRIDLYGAVVWLSLDKRDGKYNVTFPKKGKTRYQFYSMDKDLKKEIKQKVIFEYKIRKSTL